MRSVWFLTLKPLLAAKNLLPPTSLTILTLTPKKYPWTLDIGPIVYSCKLNTNLHVSNTRHVNRYTPGIISLCTCWPRIPGFLLADDRCMYLTYTSYEVYITFGRCVSVFNNFLTPRIRYITYNVPDLQAKDCINWFSPNMLKWCVFETQLHFLCRFLFSLNDCKTGNYHDRNVMRSEVVGNFTLEKWIWNPW